MLFSQWKPSKGQQRKWEKIFFKNKHISLSLITTTQAKSVINESEGMIFVDREPEKEKIRKILEGIAQTKKTTAIRISGAGGVGKTHFIRYLQFIVKTKSIIMDLDLNLKDIHFDCCIMDAPKAKEFFNFHYIYTQIWEGLGREDFFEEFAALIIKKFLNILNDVATIQIDSNLKKILGEDWRFWKNFDYLKIRNKIEQLPFDKFSELKNVLEINFRQIFSYIKKEFPTRNIRKIFSNALSIIDILIPDFEKSMQTIEIWQLTNLDDSILPSQKDEEALKKLKDLLEIYKWLYPNYVWILGLDDLDHLDDPLIQQGLFDLLKFFRNHTQNFCIILTATIDQWDYFDDSIKGTDKKKQLAGIFSSELCYFDMDYLPDHEMLNWLGRIIKYWWEKFHIILPLDGQWYPFSRQAINFIINYDPNDKTPRSVGNRLLDLWNNLTNSFLGSGKLYVESEFEAWKLFSKVDYTKLNPYTQNLLLTYRIKEKYGKFSGAIEEGLKNALEILRRSQEFRLIEIVNIKRNKKFYCENFKSKSKTRKADVLVVLQEPGGADIAKIEFQIKAGDPNREITYDELESSFDLLENNFIDFLIILSFSDLNTSVKKRLERFSGRYNITAANLSTEQQAYCVLLAYFDEIAGRKLSPFEAASIFLMIFGESPHIFFRSWLQRKKKFIETGLISKVPVVEKSKITLESFTKPITLTTPTQNVSLKSDDKAISALKWIIKKGLERTGTYKNRVTKTWLFNRKDCPDKDLLTEAWKKLIGEKKYGELVKTSFYIDDKKVKSLFESKIEKFI